MRTYLALALAALAVTLPERADIERRATVTCEKGQGMICFAVWPALPQMPGWHQDEAASFGLGANILVPEGRSYTDTTTILAGNAVEQEGYQPRHPGSLLDGFIADDIDSTRKDNPDAVITEIDSLVTADDRKLRTFLITKLKGGHRQVIVYTEDRDNDGKFFVMLMLDSTSQAEFDADQPVFRAMVAKYKHFKP